LLFLFWRWVLQICGPSWPRITILLISIFQIVRITGVSIWCPVCDPVITALQRATEIQASLW
jgi:hypothetical protein